MKIKRTTLAVLALVLLQGSQSPFLTSREVVRITEELIQSRYSARLAGGGARPSSQKELESMVERLYPLGRWPVDGWGRPLRVAASLGGEVQVYSCGEDGKAGTEDDVFADTPVSTGCSCDM